MNRFLCVLCSMVALIISACENKSAAVITQSNNDTVQSSVNTKPSLIPLFWPSDKPDIDTVRQLLTQGASLKDTDDDGRTPLMIALRQNYGIEIIKLLIDAGSDINARDNDGRTVLMVAALYHTDPAIIRLLLDKGCDVKAKSRYGETALTEAAYNRKIPLEFMKMLIDSGSDVNAMTKNSKETALKIASKVNRLEIIRLLVNSGADVNLIGDSGSPPLAYALGFGRSSDIIQFLIDQGAELVFEYPDDRKTLLMLAAMHILDTRIIQQLLDASNDPNAKDQDGNTPLLYAASYNPNPQVIRQLSKAGADITAQDNTGYTVLHHAVLSNHNRKAFMEVLKLTRNQYIIQDGRKVPLIDVKGGNGYAALNLAGGNCRKQKYQLLVKFGANPKIRDGMGETAKEALNYMVEKNADACYHDPQYEIW